MLGADKFIAQTTPYNENPVTAIFETRGLRNALVPLADTCDWDLPAAS
jgi:type VI secretion system protein VasI